MATRVLGPTGSRRRHRLALLVPFVVLAALVLAIGASATTSTDAKFEGDDGNLAAATTCSSSMDWNCFYADNGATPPVRTSPTWSGTAPFRTGSAAANGWSFVGIEDAVAPTTKGESVFGGGVKQDDECPAVNNNPDPPNKDDLKRIYIAHANVGGHIYLALAWARVPQNSTSSSAHVAFEFNQNAPSATNSCPAGSDSLVKRSTAHGGDMLVVYDFEGGSAPAILKLLRWKTSGTCEQSGKAATSSGCWVKDETFIDWAAKVNTSDALDKIAPNGDDTLKTQEFGEAIIDLTDANVLDPTNATSCVSFGRAFGVSRSSGNSGLAQMKDLVGPADVNISNCATVIIHKVTDPSTDTTTTFSFTKNFNTDPSTSNLFTLTGGSCSPATSSCTKSYSGTVFPKTDARVTESDPSSSNYLLTSITCTAASTATNVDRNATTGTVGTVPARTVEFDITAGQTLECTFTNTRQKVQSSMDTAPWYYPNDEATVNAAAGQTNIAGSVTFKLFGPTGSGASAVSAEDNCKANGATGLLYSEAVDLPAATNTSKTVSTSNYKGAHSADDSVKINSTKQVYWRVEYTPTGDSNHLGRLSNCVENINATLTGDTGGTNVP